MPADKHQFACHFGLYGVLLCRYHKKWGKITKFNNANNNNKKSNKNRIISKSKIRTSNFMQTFSVNTLKMSPEVEPYHDDSSKHRLLKLNIIVLFKHFQGMLIFITEFRKWVACSQCIYFMHIKCKHAHDVVYRNPKHMHTFF